MYVDRLSAYYTTMRRAVSQLLLLVLNINPFSVLFTT